MQITAFNVNVFNQSWSTWRWRKWLDCAPVRRVINIGYFNVNSFACHITSYTQLKTRNSLGKWVSAVYMCTCWDMNLKMLNGSRRKIKSMEKTATINPDPALVGGFVIGLNHVSGCFVLLLFQFTVTILLLSLVISTHIVRRAYLMRVDICSA